MLLTLPALDQELREPVAVVRVVDGDTLRVRLGTGTEVKVRLIGVDSPEVHPGERLLDQARDLGTDQQALQKIGEQATARVQQLVSGGQVWLEYDQDRQDRYGRTLAYVWLEGEVMLNERLLEEGLAIAFPVKPNLRHQHHFAEEAGLAREARRGLWALTPGQTFKSPVLDPRPEEPSDTHAWLVFGLLGLAGLGIFALARVIGKKGPARDDDPRI